MRWNDLPHFGMLWPSYALHPKKNDGLSELD